MAKAETFAEPVITPIRGDKVAAGFVLSILLHAAIVAVFYVSLPFFKKEPPVETPIIVDLVEIAEMTAAPPKPTPEVEPPKEEPKPEPPKPAEVTPPEPEPPPPEPPKKETPPPPPPKDEIAEILKTPPPPPPKPTPPKPKKDEMAQLQDLLKSMEKKKPSQAPATPQSNAKATNNQAPVASDRATMSELDAIRSHIEGCWRIDPGKEGIEKLSAEIRVFINPDGSVARAEIIDQSRFFLDRTFASFATSARLSVLSCKGIPITPAHYDELKEMTLNFSPQGRLN